MFPFLSYIIPSHCLSSLWIPTNFLEIISIYRCRTTPTTTRTIYWIDGPCGNIVYHITEPCINIACSGTTANIEADRLGKAGGGGHACPASIGTGWCGRWGSQTVGCYSCIIRCWEWNIDAGTVACVARFVGNGNRRTAGGWTVLGGRTVSLAASLFSAICPILRQSVLGKESYPGKRIFRISNHWDV